MEEYKIEQLQKMLTAEKASSEKYGAHITHWAGTAKPVNIDEGAIKCLIEYYKRKIDLKNDNIELDSTINYSFIFNFDNLSNANFINFQEDLKHSNQPPNMGWIGNIRAGDLCFDVLLYESTTTGAYNIVYGCYVGGIDNGYGYGKDNYPYDYFCEISSEDTHLNMSYNDFVIMSETILTDFINEEDNNYQKGISLVNKARQKLHIW